MLKELQPTENLFRLARAMFEDLWNHRVASAAVKVGMLRAELEKTQRSVDQFLDRIADAQLPSVIAAYENRIRKLEEQKGVLHEKIAHCGRPLAKYPPINVPTLNLQGADDHADRFEDTQLGQEAFYRVGFKRVVLPDCGHFLHRERPDAVTEAILEFLRESLGGGP